MSLLESWSFGPLALTWIWHCYAGALTIGPRDCFAYSNSHAAEPSVVALPPPPNLTMAALWVR